MKPSVVRLLAGVAGEHDGPGSRSACGTGRRANRRYG